MVNVFCVINSSRRAPFSKEKNEFTCILLQLFERYDLTPLFSLTRKYYIKHLTRQKSIKYNFSLYSQIIKTTYSDVKNTYLFITRSERAWSYLPAINLLLNFLNYVSTRFYDYFEQNNNYCLLTFQCLWIRMIFFSFCRWYSCIEIRAVFRALVSYHSSSMRKRCEKPSANLPGPGSRSRLRPGKMSPLNRDVYRKYTAAGSHCATTFRWKVFRSTLFLSKRAF